MKPTAYDTIPYPTGPNRTSHPDRLATNATLFGMTPAPVEQCRVLEIACGNGGNIIPMAFSFPGSRFLGIDLAESAVAEGRRTIAELGLGNIELRAMNLLDFEGGEFDYIIAHGVYSWVPPEVRDGILRICGGMLAPQGVAFVSYNAYPGCHQRRMLRDMLLFQVGDIEDPRQRMAEAVSFMEWLQKAHDGNEFGKDIEEALKRKPEAVFHDDLAAINHPVYFHEFAAHAAGHGLQFLCEGDLREMWAPGIPLPEAPLLREQYIDFARLRRFRRTLLCRAGLALEGKTEPRRVAGLFASSRATAGHPDEQGAVCFEGPHDSRATTAHPVAKAVLSRLVELWPQRIAVRDLGAEADRDAVCETLLWAYHAGIVELHACNPPFARHPGALPVASPVARVQLRSGKHICTLHHGIMEIGDESAARLLRLLDGAHDRPTLARELAVAEATLDEMLERLAIAPLLLA